MFARRIAVAIFVLSASWATACGKQGTTVGAGATAGVSGEGGASGIGNATATGGTTPAIGGSGAQGGEAGGAPEGAAGASVGGAAAGSAGADGSAGTTGTAGATAATAGTAGAAGDGAVAGTAGAAGAGAAVADAAGAAGDQAAAGAAGDEAAAAGSPGAAGAHPVTIVPPEPLTANCYLELEPGDSLDFATIVSESSSSALELTLIASTQTEADSLVTISETTAEFAESAEYPGAHAFEFELSSATNSDRLLVVVDYTTASSAPTGGVLYADVDDTNGALGDAAAIPELLASGASATGFLHLTNGGLDCCNTGDELLCRWCVNSMLMVRSSWSGVLTTYDGCNPACDAGSLCVLGLGCMAVDDTQTADCVAANTGTHYLEDQGCRFVVMHQGPYSSYRDEANAPLVEGEVVTTIGHPVEVSAPDTDGRCGFIGLLGDVAVSPPYFTDATCDTSTSQCSSRADDGDVDRYAILYIVQTP